MRNLGQIKNFAGATLAVAPTFTETSRRFCNNILLFIFRKGGVLQITNISESGIVCTLQRISNDGQEEPPTRITLDPKQTKEFGWMEGWA